MLLTPRTSKTDQARSQVVEVLLDITYYNESRLSKKAEACSALNKAIDAAENLKCLLRAELQDIEIQV